MKILKRYYAVIALIAPFLLTACADNDVYDPDKVRPVPPIENPLGEDFVAPTGFDWSMITTVKLNIEVKDEFNGMYNYLAEVFTTNPLTNATATPIAADYAKAGKNYVVEISIPKSIERVYVRQTDPKQRKEVYEFVVPGNGETLNCKLYYTATTTRTETTGSTSAYKAAQQAGIVAPEVPNYKDEINVPSKSDNPANDWGAGMKFNDGANYIITENYTETSPFTKKIQVNEKGRMSIYVKGTWNISTINDAFDIYILDGGKIISDDGLTLDERSNLTIASQGLLSVKGIFSFQCNKTINFGTIKAKSLNNSGSAKGGEFYNSGIIETTNQIALNKVTFFNCNTLETPELKLVDATFVNKANLNVEGNISINGGTLFNSANISFNNEPGGRISANSGIGTRIINHDKAQIKGYAIDTGLALYNDGTVEVFDFNSKGSGDCIYNACLMIVKNNFTFREVTLDHGSITAGKQAGTWMPTPTVRSEDNATFTLRNGSIIKAGTLTIKSSSYFIGDNTGENTDKSMIKANLIKYNWTTYLKGNLVVEATPDYSQAQNNMNCLHVDATVIQTRFDESKYEVETCGGIINEGNSGETDPENPSKPDTGDNTIYTYAFEDQWPAYGDFDMNDIVVTINKMAITDSKKLTIQGNIRAVGSSHKTGVGIQFLNVSSSGVTLSGNVQSGTPVFESGQSNPVVILSTNAHKYCNPSIADDDFTFYCTDPTAESSYNSGDGAAFEIAMTFSTAEEATKAMNVKNLDVFIISKEAQGNVGRTEIHMASYAPTNLATTALFGMGNDASANNTMLNVSKKGYYISTEGLAWGICIPSTKVWEWPKEWKMITDVYPDFKDWVTSGGANNTDWISNHNNDIYVKP